MQIVSAILDFLRDFSSLFFQILWAASKLAIETVVLYIECLKKLAIVSVLVMIIAVSTLILGVQLQSPALNAFSFCIVGLLSIIWLIVMSPLIIAKELAPWKIRKAIDLVIRSVVSAAVGTSVIASYFYVVPVWNKPQFIPVILVGLVALLHACSKDQFMDKRKLGNKAAFIVFLLTFTFFLPNWPEKVAEGLRTIQLVETKKPPVAIPTKPETPALRTVVNELPPPQAPEAPRDEEIHRFEINIDQEPPPPTRREKYRNWREIVDEKEKR